MSKQRIVFDIETDSIDAKVIRCLAWCDSKTGLINSTTYTDQIRDFFLQEDVDFIGHNIQNFDIPVIERLLGIKVKGRLIDTLGLSWILYNDRERHSLQSWGESLGVEKPIIENFAEEDIKSIIHRCETDVRINWELWKKQGKYLTELYEGNHEKILEFLSFIELKLNIVREHQEIGIKLDIDLCNKSLIELETIKEEKITRIRESMPKRAIKSVKFPPKVMFKADGSPSSNRLKWLEFLKNQGKPEDWTEEVEYISDYEEPNPSSHAQIKSWLDSLGWEPQHFKYVRQEGEKTMRKIPQIKSKEDNDGSVCPSIVKLIEKEPNLDALNGLYVLNHRISLFKGFLENQKNGRLYQGILGFATSFRHQHSIIVNLPLPNRPYAENIRKSLIASEGNILIGSDLSSLENQCSKHYIFDFDKELFKNLDNSTYDPHLSLGVEAGLITPEEAEFYTNFDKSKDDKEKYEKIKEKRGISKTSRYALSYKCGVPKLALTAGIPEKQAKKIYNAYWKANKAVLDFENSVETKTVNGQMWLKQSVNEFWYPLRNQKDKYSLSCQSLGDYIFYTWCKYVREQDIKLTFSYHDELLIECPNEETAINSIKSKLQIAMDKVNQELKLNVVISNSTSMGFDYASVH